MILAAILKLLQDNGLGTIGTDLFYERVTVKNGKPLDGIWIESRGTTVSRINCDIRAFDIYARYSNLLTEETKLNDILHFLQDAYGSVCDLSGTIDGKSYHFSNVRIEPTSSVESDGEDENGKLVKLISGEVKYNEEES